MYNNKLYSILTHFNKIEQNRLRKYLLSPYFNKNQVLVDLFEVLIDKINSQTSATKNSNGEFPKESIWESIIHDSPYDDVRFRKICSDLIKQIEGFLAQQVYEENPIRQASNLIEAVGKKRLKKLYSGSIKTAERLAKRQFYKSADFYLYNYQLEKRTYTLDSLQFKPFDVKKIKSIFDNIDNFYLLEKLRYYCAYLSLKSNIKEKDIEILFINDIINYIKNNHFEDNPPILIYFEVLMTLLDTNNNESYFKLKDLLKNYALLFPAEEAQVIYEHALNHCIRQANKGKHKFLEEYFDLYEDILKKEIIYVNGALAPLHFKNIVLAALRLKKYAWTEKFISTYQIRLPDKLRDNAVTFNLARLYLHQKKHDKVIELLREVEFDDIIYNYTSKSMLLSTYYETDEIEALYSLLESFRAFLNRHKSIPLRRRQYYLNIIKFTKKLTKIIPGDKQAIEKLKKEIEENKSVATDPWLKEKIAELE